MISKLEPEPEYQPGGSYDGGVGGRRVVGLRRAAALYSALSRNGSQDGT